MGGEYGENQAAESGAEDDFDGSPCLSRAHVEVGGECYSWEEVGEEDVDRGGEDELVEKGPVGDVAGFNVAKVLSEEAERS